MIAPPRRLRHLRSLWRSLSRLPERLDAIQLALGRIESRQLAHSPPTSLSGAEFKVWSQWGEDGIIEHLLRHVPIQNAVFVEFGVEDYVESNTRFLLRNRNWSGLVFDGSRENVDRIRRDPIYWQHNLKAECAFVTRENINDLISAHGISGDIGLLSIDIDGNDYWVWEAISIISARITIVEYNSLYGATSTVSVPYDSHFRRSRAHYSNLYWGCSLAALEHLSTQHGYVLIGCNSSGNNAFFVRADLAEHFPRVSAGDAFRAAKFRESRGVDGALSCLSGEAAISEIARMPLMDVRTGQITTVAEIAGSGALHESRLISQSRR